LKNASDVFHFVEQLVGFIHRSHAYFMREVLMAPNGKGEAFRNSPSPFFSRLNGGKLIKGAIYLDEIEQFTVRFQGGLVWNVKVCPSACSNQVISQQSSSIAY
jgi:hypothetical protein